MSLLDRFRTASRDKDPDPAVRLAYVSEIPLDDREAIAAMAREDDDARVRRAAVAKLMEPALLGRVVREDADEAVRAQATSMLRDIALEAFEGLGEAEALDAVDAVDDPRTRTHIAKTAVREIVALRALSEITEIHALGSIARHGVNEGARRGALTLLVERGDHAEILGVAMNGEHKDTVVAAVDLMSDRDHLEQIAARGKNKTAAKRARAMIREAQEKAGETAVTSQSGDANAQVASADAPETATAAAAQPVTADVEHQTVEDPDVHARRLQEEAAEQAARDARAAEESRATDARQTREAERRNQRLHELVDRLTTAADEADLALARRNFGIARKEWVDFTAGGPIEPALAERFTELEARLSAREHDARETDVRARLEALSRLKNVINRVEPLVTKSDLSLKAAERAVRDIRTALVAIPPLPTKQDADDASRRLKAALTTLTAKLQELRDADEWQRWANAGVQEQLCARMEVLQAFENAEQVADEVRSLQEQWRKAADVPRAQADALWRRFKAAHDIVWPRCEAHFAAEAQMRAENLAKKTALCEKAESLADSTNWIQTAEAIKALQAEWKTIGAVARGREKAIWERFRTACDKFFTRRHQDLSERKAVWAANLAKKVALCEQVEALAQSTDWDPTAAEVKRLQAEWKTVGPVKKSRSDAVWQRFRAACDQFFMRYAQRHDVARGERAAAREALCAELDALIGVAPAESVSPSQGAVEGDSPQPPSADQGQSDASEGAQPAPTDVAPPADLLVTVRSVRMRWQQEIAARGVEPGRARALDERYAAAYARVLALWPTAFAGSDLDPDANRKRMESLVKRVEDLAKSLAGSAVARADESLSPTSRLASMLKEALASNTIGGKVDEDSRWRAAADDVRQAQASWTRIGPVADAARRPLVDRFQRACRLILDKASGTARAGANVAGKLGKV